MITCAGIPKVAAKVKFNSHPDEVSEEERGSMFVGHGEKTQTASTHPTFLLEEGRVPGKPSNSLSLKT